MPDDENRGELVPRDEGEPEPVPQAEPPEPLDTSYEVALDDEPPPPVPVLAGEPPRIPEPEHRLPVIPEHLQTLDGVKRTLARHGGRAWHAGR